MKLPWQSTTTEERHYVGLHLGDLHVGSMVAPAPKNYRTSYESIYQLNDAQEFLWDCWQEMTQRLPMLDYISFGGDIIEGKQIKEGGNLIWEPNLLYQVEAARVLLEPVIAKLKPTGKTWYIRGSKYHVEELGNMDELVARYGSHAIPDTSDEEHMDEELATKLGAQERGGRRSRRWLLIDIDGVRLDISHRCSVVMRNRTMPLDREIEFSLTRCGRTGEQAPHGIVRHHAHCEYVTAGLGLQTGVAIPAWQLQTEFAQSSISPNRYFSAYFGSVLAHIYPDRLQDARRPIVWDDRLLFEHPKPGVEHL